MQVKHVIQWVKDIEEIKGDDEAAHAKEDRIYKAVLNAIADGHPDAQELAREALKASKIDFARWCA